MTRFEPPLVWPVFTDENALSPQRLSIPWTDSIRQFESPSFCGLTWGLNAEGVELLFELLTDCPSLKANLIIAVYPASATTSDVLGLLSDVATAAQGRLEAKVLPLELDDEAGPATVLLLNDQELHRELLWISNGENLGWHASSESHLGFLFAPEHGLRDRWLTWFGTCWESAVPLTPLTAEVPALIAAKGSSEAAERWREYIHRCREVRDANVGTDIARGPTLFADAQAEPEESGDAQAPDDEMLSTSRHDDTIRSICRNLGMQPPDKLLQKLSGLLSRGAIITVDKTSRTPPAWLPLRPELLGVPSSEIRGLIEEKRSFRVQIFDKAHSDELERRRQGLKKLIDKLTYPLGEGVRWIPEAARSLLERERGRLEREARTFIDHLLRSDQASSAATRLDRVLKDAEEIYRRYHNSDVPLPSTAQQALASELEKRLTRLSEGPFLPRVSYNAVQISGPQDSSHASNWSQGRLLLAAIARYARKAVLGKEHMKGHSIPESELLKAMDVCNDLILRHKPRDSKLKRRARWELILLEQILDQDCDDRKKCELIFDLIENGGDAVAESWRPVQQRFIFSPSLPPLAGRWRGGKTE